MNAEMKPDMIIGLERLVNLMESISKEFSHRVDAIEKALSTIPTNVIEMANDSGVPASCLLTVQQVAVRIGVHPKFVREAIRRDGLQYLNIARNGAKRKLRVSPRDLEEWIESKRAKHEPSRTQRDAEVEKYFPMNGCKKKRR